jgi:hypothetical protein
MPYTTINKGSSYFNTKLYTGTGATQSITGVGFKPDWVWIKIRNQTFDHTLVDAVRGVQKDLESNTTAAENTRSTVTVFGSDGFTVGTDSQVNSNTNTFVSWNWLGANTTVSNTSGTITSTVSANTTAGFSIVSYTGTGANATVGHGLGVAPRMIILKSRTDGAADWRVYHASVGNTGYLELNTAGATTTSSTTWQNTTPTSSVFSIGTSGTVNLNTGNFIAYCFAEIRGYSKFASYTGNGSANGTFVYTGFKPAFVMVKSTGAGANWLMQNNKTLGYNASNSELYANLTNAEITADRADLLSNGFKARINSGENNSSGVTYIYMAFAENPFVTSTQIPVTAR